MLPAPRVNDPLLSTFAIIVFVATLGETPVVVAPNAYVRIQPESVKPR